jgi:hypothetical protein
MTTPVTDPIREAARLLDRTDVEEVVRRVEALDNEREVLLSVIRILRKRESEARRLELVAEENRVRAAEAGRAVRREKAVAVNG